MSPPLEVYAVGALDEELLEDLGRGASVVVLRGPEKAIAAAGALLYQEVVLVATGEASALEVYAVGVGDIDEVEGLIGSPAVVLRGSRHDVTPAAALLGHRVALTPAVASPVLALRAIVGGAEALPPLIDIDPGERAIVIVGTFDDVWMHARLVGRRVRLVEVHDEPR